MDGSNVPASDGTQRRAGTRNTATNGLFAVLQTDLPSSATKIERNSELDHSSHENPKRGGQGGGWKPFSRQSQNGRNNGPEQVERQPRVDRPLCKLSSSEALIRN